MHKSSLPCLHASFPIPGPALQGGQYDKHMNYTSDWSSVRTVLPGPDVSIAGRCGTLCTALRNLTLNPTPDQKLPISQNESMNTPHSKIPKKTPDPARPPALVTPSPPPSKCKSPKRRPHKLPFLTKDSNITAWDHESRERDIERMAESLFARMHQAGNESSGLKEAVELYKSRGKWLSCVTEMTCGIGFLTADIS